MKSTKAKKSITGNEDGARMPVIWSEIGCVRADFAVRFRDALISPADAENQRAFLNRCYTAIRAINASTTSPFAPLSFPRATSVKRTTVSPRHHRQSSLSSEQDAPDQSQFYGLPGYGSPSVSSKSSGALAGSESGGSEYGESEPDIGNGSVSSSGSVIRRNTVDIRSNPVSKGPTPPPLAPDVPDATVTQVTSPGDDDDFFSVHGDEPETGAKWMVYTTPAKPPVQMPAADGHAVVSKPDQLPFSGTILRLLREEAAKADEADAARSVAESHISKTARFDVPSTSDVEPPIPTGTSKTTDPQPTARIHLGYLPMPWSDKLQQQVPSYVLRLPNALAPTGARRHVDEWARLGDQSLIGRGFGFANSVLPEILAVDMAAGDAGPSTMYWFDVDTDMMEHEWLDRLPDPPMGDCASLVHVEVAKGATVHASPAAVEFATWLLEDLYRRQGHVASMMESLSILLLLLLFFVAVTTLWTRW